MTFPSTVVIVLLVLYTTPFTMLIHGGGGDGGRGGLGGCGGFGLGRGGLGEGGGGGCGGLGGTAQSTPAQPPVQLQAKKVTMSPSRSTAVPSEEVLGNGAVAGRECCVAHAPGVVEWAPHLKRASGGKGGSGGDGDGGEGGGGGGEYLSSRVTLSPVIVRYPYPMPVPFLLIVL